MTDTEAIKTLLALKCGTCKGKRSVYTGYPSPDPSECSKPCPDCSGTGLLLSGLVEPCDCPPCGWCAQVNHPDLCKCGGTGYVPKEPEKALAYLVGHLLKQGYYVRFAPDRDNTEVNQIYHVFCSKGGRKPFLRGSGPTEFQALAAAIAQKEGA